MIITDEKILRQKSHPTNIDEVKKTHALEKILAALPTAWAPGTGLAAIQVGIPIRMGYYQIPGQ